MKSVLLLASCLCLVLADRRREPEDLVVKPNSYKQNCQEGDVWRDEDCNRCECDDQAKTAVCTRRKCSDGQKLAVTPGWESHFYVRRRRSSTEQHLVVKPDSYKPDCKEGDRWTDEKCNKCRCVDDKAVCTRKLCPGGQSLTPTDGWQNVFNIDPEHRRAKRETQTLDAVVKPDSYKSDCHPQDTWTDQDCNSCHCGKDKRAVCTRRTCSDGQRLQPTPDWQHALNLRH